MTDWEKQRARIVNHDMDAFISARRLDGTWKALAPTAGQEHYAGLVEEALKEAQEPWRGFVEHLLEMDVLTPGGSNEGWAKRLLAGERG